MKTKLKLVIATVLIGGAIVGITSDKQPTKAASTVTIKHGVVTVVPDATPVATATPSASGVANLPAEASSPSATPNKKNPNIVLGTPEPIPSGAVLYTGSGDGTTVYVSN